MGNATSELCQRNRSAPRFSEAIWQYIIIGTVALFIEIVTRQHSGVFFGIADGPHPYWAAHWVRDYSNGFQRRALLGEIQRVFWDPTDYRMITMFSWASSLALYVTVVAAIVKVLSEIQMPMRLALMTILLTSPATTGLIVETTGDPLQLLLTGYFALIWFMFGHWRELPPNWIIVAASFDISGGDCDGYKSPRW